MKTAFIGGVQFSHEILSSILEDGWDVSVVFSYDDSKKMNFSDFSNFDDITKKYSLKHVKVNNINDIENIEILNQIQPDLILVMGWSQLLKNDILSIPKLGVIGSHPTELPKYRGRAPIPWSILKDLKQSALTFFFIEESVDDGDILDQQKFLIDDNDDATSIYNKVIVLGKQMIISTLHSIKDGNAKRIKQDPTLFIENWPKRTPEHGKINWDSTSDEVLKLIRATTYPYPGAFTFYNHQKVIIWKAESTNEKSLGSGLITSVSKNGIKVSCKDKILLLKFIQVNDKIFDIDSNFSLFLVRKTFQSS